MDVFDDLPSTGSLKRHTSEPIIATPLEMLAFQSANCAMTCECVKLHVWLGQRRYTCACEHNGKGALPKHAHLELDLPTQVPPQGDCAKTMAPTIVEKIASPIHVDNGLQGSQLKSNACSLYALALNALRS